jgi:hypothetical protein
MDLHCSKAHCGLIFKNGVTSLVLSLFSSCEFFGGVEAWRSCENILYAGM